MMKVIGSFLGFLSSAFPEILRMFQTRQEKRHALEVLDRKIKMAKLGHTHKMAEFEVQRDMAEMTALYKYASHTKINWIEGLACSVRPVITYAFFAIYTAVKIAQWAAIRQELSNVSWSDALVHIWQGEDQALFAAVISFWFGHRQLKKK